MNRKTSISAALVAAATVWALMSSMALATPSKGVCTGCHPASSSVSVKVTQTANTGGKATYSFTVTSPGSTVGWAVFNGSTNLANGHGKTGSFTVADGSPYSLYVRDASGGVASTSFSPVAPPPAVDLTAPVTTSNAKATYAGSAAIKLTATDNVGVAHTYYTLDGATQVAGTAITVATTGSHTVKFWSVDAAGNVEAQKTAAFTITAPTTPPVTPPTPPVTPPTPPVTPPVVSGMSAFVVHVIREENEGVRGAMVTFINTVTHRRYTLQSSRTGWGTFARLPFGKYSIRVVLGKRLRVYKPVTVGKVRQGLLIRLY